MVESVFVIILACFCFIAIFQYAHLFTCKAALSHAAARAARARTVGFNHWMVEKSARVAAIPASGRRLAPVDLYDSTTLKSMIEKSSVGELIDFALDSASARSAGSAVEAARIPDYMDSVNRPTADHLLDYELWPFLDIDVDEGMNLGGSTPATLAVRVRQRQPLMIPLADLSEGQFPEADDGGHGITIQGIFEIESHYSLYMEDMNW